MRLLLFLALATTTASAQPVTVEIDLSDRDLSDATVGVRGDTPPLAWDRSLPLADSDGDGVYSATIAFPEGTAHVAYKAVIERPGRDPEWEPGDNRLLFPGRMKRDRRAFGGSQTDLPLLTVSSSQLAEDLGILRRAMGALHPGLTLHNTEAELSAISDQLSRDARGLAARFGEAIPMPAAYLVISRAVAAIRDGHTQVSMYNQSVYTSAVLYGRADRVPFAFRLIGGRMVVTGDATTDHVLPPGTEILTLDGRPVQEIITALMPYASADGSNDAKRRDLLQVQDLLAPAERFDVIYSLLFEPTGDLALTVRQPGGTEREVTVPRTTADARRDTLWARDASLPRSRGDELRLSFLDDGTALLRVGSFATFNMDVDYSEWLRSAFREMNERGTDRLVVDLRQNGGGMDDAAALLFAHLIREPTEVSFWRGVTAYDRVPDDLRPYVRSWSDDFYDLSGRVEPTGYGTFRLPERPPITIQPAPDAFDGDMAVLVDAGPSSATFYLADRIQQTGTAPLVGQTTGGSLKGLNAGQVVFLTLPNTGTTVDVPLFGSRPPEPGPDRGVIPDLLVTPDADAVIAGRDPELDAALSLLAGDLSPTPPASPTGASLPLHLLTGDWEGTLTYTDYQDDATRVTLTVTVEAAPIPDGVRLAVAFVEPDGSPGGTSTTSLRDDGERIEYDGETWDVLERETRGEGFRVVLERLGTDNRQPATVRHTISFDGDTWTDTKDVRYGSEGAFFERNTVSLRRQ